ncbi:hypothetical protein NKH18_17795 [Streptomyces sp. M10(2022)]
MVHGRRTEGGVAGPLTAGALGAALAPPWSTPTAKPYASCSPARTRSPRNRAGPSAPPPLPGHRPAHRRHPGGPCPGPRGGDPHPADHTPHRHRHRLRLRGPDPQDRAEAHARTLLAPLTAP